MPEKGETIKSSETITDIYKTFVIYVKPFAIYADFEAITEKIDSCKQNDDKSYTEAYQKHTDCGCAYKGCCVYKFMEATLEEVKW